MADWFHCFNMITFDLNFINKLYFQIHLVRLQDMLALKLLLHLHLTACNLVWYVPIL